MILALAGRLGIDPGPWTLRDLLAMDVARQTDRWNHTAMTCALMANIHRDKKKRSKPFTPSDFHPFAKPVENIVVGIEALKDFVPSQPPVPNP
ncbi:MAG: hypothetical protein WD875_16670 [Pirellulales bacterium]